MGVLYSVLPLDARTRKALAQYGVTEVPAEEGRNPTPAEVRGTLGELPGYRVEYETPSIEVVGRNRRRCGQSGGRALDAPAVEGIRG